MIRRACWICLEVVAGLAALLAVIAGVGVWRLSQGPVTLSAAAPHVERALGALHPDVRVSVGDTALTWAGWPQTVALRLTDVGVHRDGTRLARIPSADVQVSFTALLHGTLAPTRVKARGLRLTLSRAETRLRLAPPETGGRAGRDASALLARLLDDVMAAPTPGKRLSYLSAIVVSDAEVRLRDRVLDTTWRAEDARVAVRRADDGLVAKAEGHAIFGETRVPVRLNVHHTAGERAVSVRAHVEKVRPATVLAAVPGLDPPGTLTTPISAHARTRVGFDGRVGTITANLEAGAGTLTWPGRYDEPLPIAGLEARVTYDRPADRVRVHKLDLRLDGPGEQSPAVTGTAGVRGATEGPLAVRAELRARDVAMTNLDRYWPTGAGAKTRRWITANIPSGHVRQAGIDMRVVFPDRFAGTARVERLRGKLAYRDLAVHYLRPLPPVTGVDGTGKLTRNTLALTAETGALGPVTVRNGTIDITGLKGTDHAIAIDLDVRGPLRHALDVLNHPRLGFIEELGLKPAATRGTADAHLRFAFPLLADLQMEQLTARATGTLTDVTVRDFLLGQTARGGRFDLTVDTGHMKLTGPVKLGGVPLTLAWRESFGDDADPVSRMRAEIPKLPADARRRLGLDTAPYLTGPVSGTITATTHGDGSRSIRAEVDLTAARMTLDRLGWEKPPGRPGSLSARAELRDGRVSSVRELDVMAGGDRVPALRVRGSAAFDGGRLRTINLDGATVGRTALDSITVRRRADGWDIRLGGGTLDARPLLDSLGGLARGARGSGDGSVPALRVTVKPLDQVIVGDDRVLREVALNALRSTDGTWRRLRVNARVPARFNRRGDGDVPLSLQYGPRSDGKRRVTAETPNLGAALRGLDLLDSIEGGRLRFTGTSRGTAPSSPVDGKLAVRDFVVRDIPALARLLTLASLTGLADAVRGRGVEFKRLTGKLMYSGGTLATRFLHAYGPSLGITATGKVHLTGNRLDLEGTIVPAARVNRLLNKIPLLGKLLTGGEGEGVIAMRYTLSGPVDDPEIGVNPLSALTPGFLRGIFGLAGKERAPAKDWPRAVPDAAGGGGGEDGGGDGAPGK